MYNYRPIAFLYVYREILVFHTLCSRTVFYLRLLLRISPYGNCLKTSRKIIKDEYHQAVRSAVYAYGTTNITNMLAESSLSSKEERSEENICRLIPKLLTSANFFFFFMNIY